MTADFLWWVLEWPGYDSSLTPENRPMSGKMVVCAVISTDGANHVSRLRREVALDE
jgi:hypothetical protein